MLKELEKIRSVLLGVRAEFPPGWRVLRNDRKALVVHVHAAGRDLLAKRALDFNRDDQLISHIRVAREGEAGRWLRGFVPEPIFVEPTEGILVRPFVHGYSLGEVLLNPLADPLRLARSLGKYLRSLSTRSGPLFKPRGISMTLDRKMRAGRQVNCAAVEAAVTRMLEGTHPAHGDLTNRNILAVSESIVLIDAETVDQASLAWDLAHVLAAPTMAGREVSGWEHELFVTSGVSKEIAADAEILSASLRLYWLGEREGSQLALAWRERIHREAKEILRGRAG